MGKSSFVLYLYSGKGGEVEEYLRGIPRFSMVNVNHDVSPNNVSTIKAYSLGPASGPIKTPPTWTLSIPFRRDESGNKS